MAINFSGLGTFAGGMARGIESGVGLVEQHERIKDSREQRDAREGLRQFSKETGMQPKANEGAVWDETGIPVTPFEQDTSGQQIPGSGIRPATQTTHGIPTMSQGKTGTVDWAGFESEYLKRVGAFGDPTKMMEAREWLEGTRRSRLTEALMQAHSTSDDGEAARILNDAYESYVTEGMRPGEAMITRDKDGNRVANFGSHTATLEELVMAATDPKSLTKYLQDERAQAFEYKKHGDTMAARAGEQEDLARHRKVIEGIQWQSVRAQSHYQNEMLKLKAAELGTTAAANLRPLYNDIGSQTPAYLERLAANPEDEAFATTYGKDIGVVATALAGANPNRGAQQHLSTAELLLRSRDTGAFENYLKRHPKAEERWTVRDDEGNILHQQFVRNPDGTIDIVFGQNRAGQPIFIDPTDGSHHILTPDLYRAFQLLESSGGAEDAGGGGGGGGGGAAGGAETATAIPDSTAGRAGAAVRREAGKWGQAAKDVGNTLLLPGQVFSDYVLEPQINAYRDFTTGLMTPEDQ